MARRMGQGAGVSRREFMQAAALDRYDPARVFSNPFLDRLMPAVPGG